MYLPALVFTIAASPCQVNTSHPSAQTLHIPGVRGQTVAPDAICKHRFTHPQPRAKGAWELPDCSRPKGMFYK